MDDLISRQVAIDDVQYEIEMINHALDSLTLDYNTRERLRQRKGEAREILNSIETLPAVDAVPVMRCKNCKNFRRWIDTDLKFCDRTECPTSGDDYCSHGERREEHD